MPEKTAINWNHEVIEVRVFGEVTYADLRNAFAKAIDLADHSGLRRVLINAAESESLPSLIKFYKIMSTLPPHLAYATYSNRQCNSEEILRFGETVALNRFLSARYLDDRKSAILWLLAGPFARQLTNFNSSTRAMQAS